MADKDQRLSDSQPKSGSQPKKKSAAKKPEGHDVGDDEVTELPQPATSLHPPKEDGDPLEVTSDMLNPAFAPDDHREPDVSPEGDPNRGPDAGEAEAEKNG